MGSELTPGVHNHSESYRQHDRTILPPYFPRTSPVLPCSFPPLFMRRSSPESVVPRHSRPFPRIPSYFPRTSPVLPQYFPHTSPVLPLYFLGITGIAFPWLALLCFACFAQGSTGEVRGKYGGSMGEVLGKYRGSTGEVRGKCGGRGDYAEEPRIPGNFGQQATKLLAQSK